MKFRLYIVLWLFFPAISFAQNWQLEIVAVDRPEEFTEEYKKNHNTELDARKELKRFGLQLQKQGYAASSFDSIVKAEKKITAYLYYGKKYEWGKIGKGNAEDELISAVGFREKSWNHRVYISGDFASIAEKIIRYYEDRGYPFASVKLDSIKAEGNQFNGVLNIKKNRLYKIDSLLVKGDAQITSVFLENYIGISPGDPYNETLLRQIDLRIKEIPFVELARLSELVFTETQCHLYIYLKKKKASQFNGILGILPDNKTGKIVITGDARIRLKNAFSKGELIDLNWRKLNNGTQDLKVNFNYPFLFKSHFGTDLNFKLYKRDSTFLELHKNAAIQYQLKGGNYFKVFVTNNTSDLLTPSMFTNATVLPTFADVSTNLFGAGIKAEKLDYRLNPRRGFSIQLEASAGNKKIRKNPKLDQALYDQVNLNSAQYQITNTTELYIPLFKRNVIKLAANSGYIYNNNLFLNELYRIGGIRTLRGFDEESISTSAFSIGTFEYRFLLEQNSAFYLFFDAAWYEKNTRDAFFTDTPYGFGGGIYFQTKAGTFSMNYAMGSQQGNPILLRASKVHFGFINYF